MQAYSRWAVGGVIVAVLLGQVAEGAEAVSARAAAIVTGIQSTLTKEAEASIRELDTWSRGPKPSMAEADLLALFDACGKSVTPQIADTGARLLVRFAKNSQIIALAKKTVAEKDPSGAALVAALRYLENTDDQAFEGYFSGKKYEQMPAVVREYFMNRLTVNYLRWEEKDVEVLAQLTMKWKSRYPDDSNPFHSAIVKFRGKAVPALVKAQPDPAQLTMATIYLLGEIGSAEALPHLLREYQRKPSTRVAISMGACLDQDNLETLFTTIKEDEPLRKIIEEMAGPGQMELAKSTRAKLKEYVGSHWEEIRNECQKRSIPVVG